MTEKPVAAGKSSYDLINRTDFLKNVSISPDAQVLDAACGIGLYSIELSKLLGGRGVIHAVDLWEEGIASLKKTIAEEDISSIHPIHADITKQLPLESESIDFCLMATILHDLTREEQDGALKEIVRVLKPDGVLAVIEFKKIDKGPGPPIGIRISEQEAEDKLDIHGFQKIYLGELGDYMYLLSLRKNL